MDDSVQHIPIKLLSGMILVTSASSLIAWPVPEGRITGGGSFFLNGMRITHGFELHCNPSVGPNNLEINWNGGYKFHLTTLQKAPCWDTGISPGKPNAPFDQFFGFGTGTYNGVAGATIDFQLTDHGELGRNDSVSYLTITDASGAVVLNLSPASGPCMLDSENHQAHAQN